MKELSLNILDITENSVKAGARHIGIALDERGGVRTLTITDDGCGMDAQTVARVTDPFYTTRTTRSVGMGLSLLKLAAEQTGGGLTVESRCEKDSPEDHGTIVTAVFHPEHIDCVPLGDITATLVTLIQGSPEIDFLFTHTFECGEVRLDTAELRGVLGEVSLAAYEVLQWIEAFVNEQYAELRDQIQ